VIAQPPAPARVAATLPEGMGRGTERIHAR
jgi:hypothetical protein